MNRRDFIRLSASISLAIPMMSHARRAAASTPYAPELVQAELDAGKTVVLDFTASWCPSCQLQGRNIDALRAENPAYEQSIAFFDLDWDTYKGTEIATRYGVRSRGALVVLRGDKVIAQTYTHSTKDALKALLDQAAAAS